MRSNQPRRVLVIHDSASAAEPLSGQLTDYGYDCESAAGDEALEHLAKHRFDAVVLDASTPATRGFQTLEHIRRAFPRDAFPVILIVARERPNDLVVAFDLGAQDGVQEPVDLQALCARLEHRIDTATGAGASANTGRKREHGYALKLRNRAIDATGLGLMITTPVDSDCTIVDVNPAFEEITGYSRGESVGRNPRFLRSPVVNQEQQVEYERLRHAVSQARPIRALLNNRRKDGSPFWNELSIAPVFDDEHTPTNFVGVMRDVTERVDTEEKLRLMADALPMLLVYFDHAGIYRMVNKTAETWYARPAAEILGKSAAEILGEDVVELYRSHARRAGMAQRSSFETEFTYPDGRTRHVEAHHIPQLDVNGDLSGYYTMVIDITEREKARAQLLQAQKMESIGQLSGGIAHDFNNLLSIIRGNLQLLARGGGIEHNEKLSLRIGAALDAVDRGADLTHRLLTFSRRQQLEKTIIDVAAHLREMDRLLQRAIGETIELETCLATDLPCIEGDLSQLENAVLNLAVNARDAMPAGGKLTIETRRVNLGEHYAATHAEVTAGDYILIAVSDNGQGMPPEVLERAFEPFFTTKESGRGTGLGLASIFGYVKQCGGHVSIYSEEGFGTTVNLYFPVAEAGAAVPAPEQPPPRASPSTPADKKHTILVVDDNSDVLNAVAELLRMLGYRVFEAQHGSRALEILEQEQGIDLLFTDMVMPGGIGGLELADKAREKYPELKVLFTSGYAQEATRRQGDYHSADWIHKPVDIDDLESKIRKLLAS